MTKVTYEAWTLERLDRLLAAYGGNDKRWPETDRKGLASFLAGNAEGRRRVREAVALDAVLDKCAFVSSKVDARIIERIVAAAEQDKAPASAVIVPFKSRVRLVAKPAVGRTMRWREASLLAATLLVGLYIGAAGIADRVLTGDGDSEFESALVVLPSDLSVTADEETL
jgi:hypothetical protein